MDCNNCPICSCNQSYRGYAIMWILLLVVVSINDAYSPDATIQVPIKTEKECKQAVTNMTYWSKLNNYRITSVCKKLY
jgi:hypothetical protein